MQLWYVHGLVMVLPKLQMDIYEYERIIVVFTNEREFFWLLFLVTGLFKIYNDTIVIPFLPINNNNIDKKIQRKGE